MPLFNSNVDYSDNIENIHGMTNQNSLADAMSMEEVLNIIGHDSIVMFRSMGGMSMISKILPSHKNIK